MVVGPNESLQRRILQQYHDHKLAGHLGIANMWWTLRRDYWWPTMKQFVVQYVKGCATCQSTKPQNTWPKVPLMPVLPTEGAVPFQTISLDLIMNLPKVEGHDSILTIVDHDCTKMALFFPCAKMIDALGVATLYAQQVFPYFGEPRKVISDWDPRFTSKFKKELCSQLGIDQGMSTVYCP